MEEFMSKQHLSWFLRKKKKVIAQFFNSFLKYSQPSPQQHNFKFCFKNFMLCFQQTELQLGFLLLA